MSIIVEVAGMLSGMLMEYATSKKWSKVKAFFIVGGCFFSLFTTQVLIFPGEKGVFVGILYAVGLGITCGLIFAGGMHYHEKYKK